MSTLLYKYLVEAVATMFSTTIFTALWCQIRVSTQLARKSFMAVKESNTSQNIQQQQQQQQQQEACDPCKSFGQKCSHIVKKQRAKFYILRRCIAMLLCWHERGDT
ncbi:hypothetical protein AAZX31_03G163700 [Glycine max]|uniref:Uncharacterized protein n=2 Tax=Glycine subgen. Soja TaxID=1462606 RepID=I1JPP2_SOYBN|nr:uncharacterized protein LOC102661214 [Glycine max]XP_028223821.1 uncharacterized protein LOC114405542 [Glycine soja]KAG5043776.1 hypothetical protein JHK87_007691 [Glycine soja]KAG5055566.1 hypothetical protein JHK85_008076 [Glycine max]KAG5072629.1 hypothetical protein JHK86_007840 [Glycine max]KAH1070638.1 hypothetical protein GYH30_007619 [Glycine max]KHN09516.1 hypothetical protein glysoja_016615 [Glycine soja]|eukprot:XP_006577031.1 uncharacterized protein LOC102661214 [Glycine max]